MNYCPLNYTQLYLYFTGESGSGKTQFCFQLAINTQLPNVQGGLNGEVIFIDTENTFSSDRLIEMININLQNLALSGLCLV